MARKFIDYVVQTTTGDAVEGALVTIVDRSTGNPSTVYRGETGTSNFGTNHILTDSAGRINGGMAAAWLGEGSYTFTVTASNLTTTTVYFDGFGLDSMRGSQAANVLGITVPDRFDWDTSLLEPLNVVPVPKLIPGVTKMEMHMFVEVRPLDGCFYFMLLINEVDVNGHYLGNLAFTNVDRPTVGDSHPWSAHWLYDPRPTSPEGPDIDLGDGVGRYLGVHVLPRGGDASAFSTYLGLIAGPIESITIDASSSSLLDDAATP